MSGSVDYGSGLESQPYGKSADPLQFFELRYKDGRRSAFSYSSLTEVHLERDGVLALVTPRRRMKLHGSALRVVYQLLLERRLQFVQEDSPSIDDGQNTVVERIDVIGRDSGVSESDLGQRPIGRSH